ncbi:hypothetical protein MUO14_11355 [Halobacillus shinanisalinarum]|uniref:Uncharacterized protein n=1 Tax=Halobacillus shinanisalinarum TaxID=2932258 RepID=A0ABY4H5T4_9BACI|nr:hypothetical protein [Halobacillus shinanisalinarum]UOQ95460.1 hypothetical protein MUO14_11355 [Halobacillus shinanisalinarum]
MNKRDREILGRYHQYLTEKELKPLYESFEQWNAGDLDYDELTERIHVFHKKNQQIWSTFNGVIEEDYLIFQAKKEMNLLNEEDLTNQLYRRWLGL